MLDTILIPIVKDKSGDLTSKDNYRPIAITTVMSKLLEMLLLMKYASFFNTGYNQFGFKAGHSTDLCTFIMNNVIDYYSSLSSPVFLCFLDASKAFDRLNFWILFSKLLSRGLPALVVKLLVFWYTQQRFCVRWSDIVSDFFLVSNGVRQGGVLSPYLFNVYTDELSKKLNDLNVGCMYNNKLVNHLMYADDMLLMTPSANALQSLLSVCEIYAKDCFIKFNLKKTVYLCIKPKKCKLSMIPTVYLDNTPLKLVTKQKYLGNVITSDNTDDCDILNQVRSTYARGNMLIKYFKHCSNAVKCSLFKTYCYNFYCCHLWRNFRNQSSKKLKVAYNNIFRKLFMFDSRTSISHQLALLKMDHIYVILRKSIYRFAMRVQLSNNVLIRTIADSFVFTSSKLYTHWCDKLYL